MNNKKLPKNVFRHPNGNLWVNKVHGGRRLRESLHTRNVELAKKRAAAKVKAFVAAVEDGKWGDLDKTRTKRSIPTIGQVVDAYAEFADLHGHAPSTRNSYTAKLRRIVGRMFPGDWRQVSTAALTPELCDRYVEDWLVRRAADIRADGRRRQQTINLAQSLLRNASALFSGRARRFYASRGLVLPLCVADFGPATSYRAKTLKYTLPPAELIRRTLTEGRGLGGTLWLVFAGAFDLACRGDELAACRRDWFAQDARGDWWMRIEETEDWAPKGRPHRKPVPAALMERIFAEMDGRDTYLPGATYRPRLECVQRGAFPAWMTRLGWQTQKRAHELRKLRACWTYHHTGPTGPLDAKRLLGHSSLATTESYYADLLGIPIELHPLFERTSADGEGEKDAAGCG